jgi:hypothetical protein
LPDLLEEKPLITVVMSMVAQGKLVFGPKGLCILLSHMQRLRQQQLINLNEITIDAYRDQAWQYAVQEGVVTEKTLNGRICDALLRSFNSDVVRAKQVWKSQLLPLAEAVRLIRGSTDYMEIAEKSFEAMMFVSGRSRSPELALEIAKSVRKRDWILSIRKKLALAYYRGRLQSNNDKGTNLFENIVNGGIEKSIESELGVLFETLQEGAGGSRKSGAQRSKLPVIRFKLK